MTKGVRDIAIGIVTLFVAIIAISPAILAKNLSEYLSIIKSNLWLIVTIGSPILSATAFLIFKPRTAPNEKSAQGIGYANRLAPSYQTRLTNALNVAKRIDAIGIANNRLTTEMHVDFYRDFLTARKGEARLLFLDAHSQSIRDPIASNSVSRVISPSIDPISASWNPPGSAHDDKIMAHLNGR